VPRAYNLVFEFGLTKPSLRNMFSIGKARMLAFGGACIP
jgi:hypothetical protein